MIGQEELKFSKNNEVFDNKKKKKKKKKKKTGNTFMMTSLKC